MRFTRKLAVLLGAAVVLLSSCSGGGDPTCPQPPLGESFDAPNPAGATGAMRWTGDGTLRAEFPIELTGTGADGAFTPPGDATVTILDTDEMVGGQSRKGVWNFTDVTIPVGASVRVVGPYLAHFRCTGAFTNAGSISANAGTTYPHPPGLPPWEFGPFAGLQNNGFGVICEALGGVGNAGGGAGGTGSGITPPPGSSPRFQCATRADAGENGFGPRIDGAPNPGSPPHASYGGGQGGDSGCFPASGAGCTAGDIGGLGGAGGSAGRAGESGLPRQNDATCSPATNVAQPIAQAPSVPLAMVPPIGVQSAGSGGGGGGDHFDSGPVLAPPSYDDSGAGGGGGGGGLRVSCVGPYSQSGAISAKGAMGNVAQNFGGCGGSGSGGEVWIQSFSTVTLTALALIDVTGPPRIFAMTGGPGCFPQAAGGGGAGLVQIEAGQGPVVTPSFLVLPTPTPTTGAIFSAPPFAYSGAITGQGRSGLRYTGVSAPDYTGATEVFTLGNAAGATLTIRYEGALEAINSTPANPVFDPTTIRWAALGGAPITAANLDELDGYPFIEWVVDVSFPPPPTTPLTAILPSVDSISISFRGACP